MSDLNKLSLKEAILGIKENKFSSKELLNDTFSRIKELEGKIKAFVTVCEGQEGEDGKDGNDLPLLGIPMAVKDVLSTKNIRTTASSKILENYIPPYDAIVVKKLKEAGAIIIGKTNCDAFAFGASTENSGFGPTKNPWDLECVPGGSSGGSAAAVSADECIFALGTDTGGSIRQPASFCSISGLKPTYGACSRYGLLAMSSSFDTVGPMGKTVEDCEIVFNIMKGKDPKDGTSSDGDRKDKDNKDKITIGLPKEFFADGIDNEVKEAVMKAASLLGENGFDFEEVDLPHLEFAIPAYYIIVPSEISSNMARYDGIRFGYQREKFEDEVKRRVMLGTYALSAGYYDQYYTKASKVRKLIQEDFFKCFDKVDFILGPVSPHAAFKIGEKSNNPLEMYLEDILTGCVNLSGLPALALPCGFTKEGLPIGMQILGPHFSEEQIFKLGKMYQTITDWHKRKPII